MKSDQQETEKFPRPRVGSNHMRRFVIFKLTRSSWEKQGDVLIASFYVRV